MVYGCLFLFDFQIESEANLQQLNQAIDSLENKVTLKNRKQVTATKDLLLRLRETHLLLQQL